MVPALELLYAANEKFWHQYWSDSLASHPCEKWTTNKYAAQKYGLHWIAERLAPGLSRDPALLHHGHGSGYSLVNLAYLKGAKRIVLLGYDCKYAIDYSGEDKRVGSSPRHYFGEYPSDLLHWPKVSVRQGVHVGLVELYRSIAKQGLIEILNATPGSAIDCFPRASINAL